MYPYHQVGYRSDEDPSFNQFAFWDNMHFPGVVMPFDSVWAVGIGWGCPEAVNRIFLHPSGGGFTTSIVNGFVYFQVLPEIVDHDRIAERAEMFRKRAGHYMNNWTGIYSKWTEKVTNMIRETESLQFNDLPKIEKEDIVINSSGIPEKSWTIYYNYSRLINLIFLQWHYHFEMLDLSYAIQVTFFDFCKSHFTGITDKSIVDMLMGLEIALYRPDEECKRLAELAVHLNLQDAIHSAEDFDDLGEIMGRLPNGERFLDALNKSRNPWFNFYSEIHGWNSTYRTWNEDTKVPLRFIKSYVNRVIGGEKIYRDIERLREKSDEVYADYLGTLKDGNAKANFTKLRELARQSFSFLEDHDFYLHCWFPSVVYSKMRQLGDLMVLHGLLKDKEDIFLFNHYEIPELVFDLLQSNASGLTPKAQHYLSSDIGRRKGIIQSLTRWKPPQILGPVPSKIVDPLLIMLFALTSEKVARILKMTKGDTEQSNLLIGIGGSGGIAEGPARVVNSADQLDSIAEGDVLVCRSLSPAWAPVYNKLVGVVSDIGGIMSHAAIVAREYGLPAVLSTETACDNIRSGMKVRVNGDLGTVEILGNG